MTDPAILRQARIDLAAALRWGDRHGFGEGIGNHFSFMVPGTNDRFLINPQKRHWRELTASKLLLVGAEGQLIEGDGPPERTAYVIHWRVHRAVPQARCILHCHAPYATALTLRREGRLEMCEQNALIFYGRLAYDDDYGGLALDGSEGDRIAAKLGNASALMLASHGVIVTGRNVAEAFTDLYYLERAAQAQVLAASGGHALRTIPEDVQRRTAQQHMQEYDGLAQRLFGAYRRILDREEPDYRA